MTNDDRIAALFGSDEPIADEGFTARVLALAALEDRIAERRRAGSLRLAFEAAALGAVLVAFTALARVGPPGEIVPLASPAMVGLLLLASWLAVGVRGAPHGS